jgi:hypothetical protein
MLLVLLAITSTLSQDLSAVWYGNAKTPDDKGILFAPLFEKNKEICNTTLTVPTIDVSCIIPKAASLIELKK